MKLKPYVLATKWGWFPEFQMLSIIVTKAPGRIKAERLYLYLLAAPPL